MSTSTDTFPGRNELDTVVNRIGKLLRLIVLLMIVSTCWFLPTPISLIPLITYWGIFADPISREEKKNESTISTSFLYRHQYKLALISLVFFGVNSFLPHTILLSSILLGCSILTLLPCFVFATMYCHNYLFKQGARSNFDRMATMLLFAAAFLHIGTMALSIASNFSAFPLISTLVNFTSSSLFLFVMKIVISAATAVRLLNHPPTWNDYFSCLTTCSNIMQGQGCSEPSSELSSVPFPEAQNKTGHNTDDTNKTKVYSPI